MTQTIHQPGPVPTQPRSWARAALARFTAAPDGLIASWRRFHTISRVGMVLGLAIHTLFLVIFASLELWVLAAFNVFSVAAFLFALALSRRGRLIGPFWLAGFEVIAHAVLATVWLGLDAGFQYYLLVTAAVVVLAPYYRLAQRIAVAAINVALMLALVAGGSVFDPVATIDAGWLLAFQIGNLAGLAAVAGAIVVTYSVAVDRAEAALADAYAQSERLLANVMPEKIAARLKAEPGTIAEDYEAVSVLFADIVDFTTLSAALTAEEVVRLLDGVFSDFDRLVEARGLEKIKTIGDAYMAVAGVPEPRADHAATIVELAREMMAATAHYHDHRGRALRLRIGIHSGRVAAGVIGQRKFAYDLWGDTVNLAARLEASGEPGRIQVSDETRRLAGDVTAFEARGPVDIKGKGALETWFVAADAAG